MVRYSIRRLFELLLISLPSLVLGLLLQRYVSGTLRWFPTIGWPEGEDLWLGGWSYTVLPTLAGSLTCIASYSRLMKASILDVVGQDYILTAEAKGLNSFEIVCHHILRNSFIPIIMRLPMSVAMCITGSFMIEKIFSIQGIALYRHPLHPYTRSLLEAIPIPDPEIELERQKNRQGLFGEIPSPANPPAGCRFSTRCPMATPRCMREAPELRQVGGGHCVACHCL